MNYLLEIGQLSPSKRGYTYQRSAQAVTYTLQWTQIGLCETWNELVDFFMSNYSNIPEIKGRIMSFGKRGEPVWAFGNGRVQVTEVSYKPDGTINECGASDE